MEKSTIEKLLQECLYFTANQLARMTAKIADEEFRVTGLSPTYAFLLLIVNEKQEISQKELAEILHMAPSTITRFIEKLQMKGLVDRKQLGRQSLIYPTSKGLALQKDIEQAWLRLDKRFADELGRKEGDSLTRQLYTISAQLDGRQS